MTSQINNRINELGFECHILEKKYMKWKHIKQCIDNKEEHSGSVITYVLKLKGVEAGLKIKFEKEPEQCYGELVFNSIKLGGSGDDSLDVHLDENNVLKGKPQPPKWEHVKRLLGNRNSIQRGDNGKPRIRFEIRYWEEGKSPLTHKVNKIRRKDNLPSKIQNWLNCFKDVLENPEDLKYESGSGWWIEFDSENYIVPILVGIANFGLALKQIHKIFSMVSHEETERFKDGMTAPEEPEVVPGSFDDFKEVVNELLGYLPRERVEDFVASGDHKLYLEVYDNGESEEERWRFVEIVDDLLADLPEDRMREFFGTPDFKIYEKFMEKYS